MRIQTLRAAGLYRQGMNVELAMCAFKPQDDPLWRVVWEPVAAFSREWWRISSKKEWAQRKPPDMVIVPEMVRWADA